MERRDVIRMGLTLPVAGTALGSLAAASNADLRGPYVDLTIAVMEAFGVEPRRCHSFEAEPARRVRRFARWVLDETRPHSRLLPIPDTLTAADDYRPSRTSGLHTR